MDAQPAQPTPQPVKPKPFLKILIVLLLIALPVGGFFAGQKTVKSKSAVVTKNNTITPSPTQNMEPIKFADTLSKYCAADKKVSLDMLPIDFSQELKSKYGINDSLPCEGASKTSKGLSVEAFDSGEEYLSSSIAKGGKDVNQLFVYHLNSQIVGMFTTLPALSKMNPFVFNNKAYWVEFIYPAPIGTFHTSSATVVVTSEKLDHRSGTIVRIEKDVEMKNFQFVKDYIKKHGRKNDGFVNEEVYELLGNAEQNKKFELELMALSLENHVFDEAAKEIGAELDGITFKE